MVLSVLVLVLGCALSLILIVFRRSQEGSGAADELGGPGPFFARFATTGAGARRRLGFLSAFASSPQEEPLLAADAGNSSDEEAGAA